MGGNFDAKKFKAITNDSITPKDFKDIEITNTYADFSTKKKHHEFYCTQHMKSRLLNLCHQNTLVDVILSGTNFILEMIGNEELETYCRETDCKELASFVVVRF